MNTTILILFPDRAGSDIRGSKPPLNYLIPVALIGLPRSLIHVFAGKGGTGSIAGMELLTTGAGCFTFAFAQPNFVRALRAGRIQEAV